jgi:hypothetical protein
MEIENIVTDELEAVRSSLCKVEEIIRRVNEIPGCKVHRVGSVRWDSAVIDITLDPRRLAY